MKPAGHDHRAPVRAEIARTLRLLVALALVTILIVMLLHGLNVL
jgi:hypothetical protein